MNRQFYVTTDRGHMTMRTFTQRWRALLHYLRLELQGYEPRLWEPHAERLAYPFVLTARHGEHSAWQDLSEHRWAWSATFAAGWYREHWGLEVRMYQRDPA